jgi:hypothetical protein
MNNTFKIENQAVPHFDALQALVVPAPRESNVIQIDYSVSTDIAFFDLLGSHVLNISNVTGLSPVMTLPSNADLLLLFENPQVKSLLKWTIETDSSNPLTINSDDDSVVITTGVWALFIQIIDPVTPTFNLISHAIGGSITMPSPIVLTVPAGGTTWSVNFINNGSGLDNNATALLGTPTATDPITMDSATNYWTRLFGSNAPHPGFGIPVVYTGVVLSNGCSVNLTLVAGTGITLTGITNLQPGASYSVVFRWTSQIAAVVTVTTI